MRAFDRDLIRGGHYGQRSCVPRKQAEHMAAPTNAASEDSPCQPGAVHTWPISEVAARLIEVRLVGRNGLDLLTLSSSHFDPKATSASRCRSALRPKPAVSVTSPFSQISDKPMRQGD
jgi:hypothetical protein